MPHHSRVQQITATPRMRLSSPQRTPDMATQLRAMRGVFAEGYCAASAAQTLSRLCALTGLTLAIGWTTKDAWGFGGDSDLYLVEGTDVREAPAGLMDLLIDLETSDANLDTLVRTLADRRPTVWAGIRHARQRARYSFLLG